MSLISLSSIPPRFGLIGPTLEALVAQAGVERVELYLPERYVRFPDWDGQLPAVPAGVTIRRVAVDLGPATKVLPAVRRYRGQDVQILFCDDDRDYRPGWAQALLAAQAARPGLAVALAGWDIAGLARGPGAGPRHRARSRRWDMAYRAARLRQILRGGHRASLAQKPPRRIIARAGLADVFEGYGGVVVRPDFFDGTAFDIPAAAFHVDDVWLSGMLARRGIGIWLPADLYEPKTTEADRQAALYRERVADKGRRELDAGAIALLQERFGIWG